MFSSRLTLQGDGFSSDTAIDLPQTGRKEHKKFASLSRADVEPFTAKKNASTGMLAQLQSAAGRDLMEY